MFAVESHAAVGRFVFVEGHSRGEAARVFGLNRETVAKMWRFSLPPGYTRKEPAAKPKPGPLLPVIGAILEAEQTAPVKQRHMARRIFERLRDEHGFAGGHAVVKDHVRLCRARGRETFVPLAHPPGQQRDLSAVKLLIIDELGYVPLSPTGAGLLFEVVAQRYGRGSTIVTSNLPIEDWTQVPGSERFTGALLDRRTHHVSILTMNGDSYRLEQSAGRRRSTARAEQNPATEIIDPRTGEIITAVDAGLLLRRPAGLEPDRR